MVAFIHYIHSLTILRRNIYDDFKFKQYRIPTIPLINKESPEIENIELREYDMKKSEFQINMFIQLKPCIAMPAFAGCH